MRVIRAQAPPSGSSALGVGQAAARVYGGPGAGPAAAEACRAPASAAAAARGRLRLLSRVQLAGFGLIIACMVLMSELFS